MILAVEDVITEAVARKIVSAIRPDLAITNVIGQRGRGYIQRRARELNRSATSLKVLIIADLNSASTCAPDLRLSWFGTARPHALFRVAVMEVESWVLADRPHAASMLGVPVDRIPMKTDEIRDPKEYIVRLARRSRFPRIRRELVPDRGSTATVGPAYNPRLIAFITNTWDPIAGAHVSESLARAIHRIEGW